MFIIKIYHIFLICKKKTIFFKGGIKMSLTREEFIRKIKDDVMKDAKISKILPSLTIASNYT